MDFDDLDDDCLMSILEHFTPEQLLKVCRINKRLKRLALIKLSVNVKVFSICSNWFAERRKIFACRHQKVAKNQLMTVNTINGSLKNEFDFENSFDNQVAVLLAKCSGVKAVYFNYHSMNAGLLLELVRLCPEVECFRFTETSANINDWSRFFEQTGRQIVHLQIKFKDNTFVQHFSLDQFLEIVVSKCTNIKLIDLVALQSEGFIDAIKKVPKDFCWIRVNFQWIDRIDPIEDLVENIDALSLNNYQSLNWPVFGNTVKRLSRLEFHHLIFGFPHHNFQSQGVVFAGLKKLKFTLPLPEDNRMIDCLSLSRFPQLESVYFDAPVGLTEDDFSGLLKPMESVSEMKISIRVYRDYEQDVESISLLPGASIHWLRNLKTFKLNLKIYRTQRPIQLLQHPERFLQPLERYVDEVESLKKLIVDATFNQSDSDWSGVFGDWKREMKLKQEKVEVVFKEN